MGFYESRATAEVRNKRWRVNRNRTENMVGKSTNERMSLLYFGLRFHRFVMAVSSYVLMVEAESHG